MTWMVTAKDENTYQMLLTLLVSCGVRYIREDVGKRVLMQADSEALLRRIAHLGYKLDFAE